MKINWQKVLLAVATTLSAVGAAVPGVWGPVLTALGAIGLYLTRPSQTSAKAEKISDAIPGNPGLAEKEPRG